MSICQRRIQSRVTQLIEYKTEFQVITISHPVVRKFKAAFNIDGFGCDQIKARLGSVLFIDQWNFDIGVLVQ